MMTRVNSPLGGIRIAPLAPALFGAMASQANHLAGARGGLALSSQPLRVRRSSPRLTATTLALSRVRPFGRRQ
jgi:hypothetical protein